MVFDPALGMWVDPTCNSQDGRVIGSQVATKDRFVVGYTVSEGTQIIQLLVGCGARQAGVRKGMCKGGAPKGHLVVAFGRARLAAMTAGTEQ